MRTLDRVQPDRALGDRALRSRRPGERAARRRRNRWSRLATVRLIDVTPGADLRPTHPVPSRAAHRHRTSCDVVSHTLLLFPSIPLDPAPSVRTHHHAPRARRPDAPVRGVGGDGRVFARRQRSPPRTNAGASTVSPTSCSPPQRCRGRRSTARRHRPGAARDDRRHDGHRRRSAGGEGAGGGAPPPAYTITNVEPGDFRSGGGDRAAAPGRRRTGARANNFERDGGGAPQQTRVHAVPFTLALPEAALQRPGADHHVSARQSGQHARPRCRARRGARWRRQGFAVIGFTDILNRELSAGVTDEQQAILAQVAPVLAGILAEAARARFLGRDARRADRLPALHRRPRRARRAADRRARRRAGSRRPTAPRMLPRHQRGRQQRPRHPAVRAGDPAPAALVAGGARLARC